MNPHATKPEPTVTLLTVYASEHGHTREAALAHAEGATRAGALARVLDTDQASPDDLVAADALVLGSPVHMGLPHWRMKRFIDQVCGPMWIQDALVGKIGGAFVTGGGYGNAGGSADSCLSGLLCNLAQLGFVLVPLPRMSPGYIEGGSPFGPYCRTQGTQLEHLDPADIPRTSCIAHGYNIARLAQQVRRFAFLR